MTRKQNKKIEIYVFIAVGPPLPSRRTLCRIILKFEKSTTVQRRYDMYLHKCREREKTRTIVAKPTTNVEQRELLWISTNYCLFPKCGVVFLPRKRQQVQQYWPRTKHATGVSWYVNDDVRVALDENDPPPVIERNTRAYTHGLNDDPGVRWTDCVIAMLSPCACTDSCRFIISYCFRGLAHWRLAYVRSNNTTAVSVRF